MNAKISCWEYLSCRETSCPAYGRHEIECWREPGTLCHGESTKHRGNKFASCVECPVFRSRMDDEVLCSSLADFHAGLKKVECCPDATNPLLAVELAEVHGMLYKLSQGDFNARLSLTPSTGVVSTLKKIGRASCRERV